MSGSRISLEQITNMPGASYDLPVDELYVRLGCASCTNAVCFKARGVTSYSPDLSRNPEEAKDIQSTTDGVGWRASVHTGISGVSYSAEEECSGPCTALPDIEVAVELLNERFGATLELPL